MRRAIIPLLIIIFASPFIFGCGSDISTLEIENRLLRDFINEIDKAVIELGIKMETLGDMMQRDDLLSEQWLEDFQIAVNAMTDEALDVRIILDYCIEQIE